MTLEHEEILTLARFAHHVGGTGNGPLDHIMTKLYNYAERAGVKLEPLQLNPSKIAGSPERLGFRCDTLAPGK